MYKSSIEAIDFEAVNKAFSKQSGHFDAEDFANPILTEWRQQVYAHVNSFLKPNSFILELNAGTGIDAVHFARQGHRIHATDISDGMVEKINSKIIGNQLSDKLSFQQCSYEELDKVEAKNFDFIFSNFGGLNCTNNLSKVARHFNALLKPGGYATMVIMPPVCLWEWLWIFKGHGKKAFRRLNKNGSMAHLEGEYFLTYYFSVVDIRKAMGKNFELVSIEGLGSISPPPSKADFAIKRPKLYKFLRGLDASLRHTFPFNRWADHVIVTFRLA